MSRKEQMIESLSKTAREWADYSDATGDRDAGGVAIVLLALKGFFLDPTSDSSALVGLVGSAAKLSEEALARHREIPS